MTDIKPLADARQFGARIGEALQGRDLMRAEAVLADASALVRSVAGLDWIDDHGELEEVPAAIQTVVLQVAVRAYRNPEGIFQSTVGDVSVSYGREGNGGAVFLTKDEEKIVRREAHTGGGMSSIGLVSPYYPTADVLHYAPVEGGGDPIPMGPYPWDVF